jgi:hypothetical protein
MTDRSAGSKARELSYSQLSTWLRCRRAWAYAYGLRAKPKESVEALEIGTAVHMALEAFFRGQDAALALDQWYEAYLANPPLGGLDFSSKAKQLRDNAEVIYGRVRADVDSRGLVVLADAEGTPYVEYELSAPLEGWDRAVGYTDVILYDPKNETVWLADWKTRGYFAGYDSTAYDLQGMMYQYMARLEGIPAVGVITYQVSSKPPVLPSVNKNGSLSRAKVACDWGTYAAYAESLGQDPAMYEAEMRPKLADFEPVRPLFALRSDETLQNVWDTVVVPAAKQIAIARDAIAGGTEEELSFVLGSLVRNLSNRECSRCRFASPCIAALSNYDELAVLEERFTYDRDRRDRIYS